MRIKRKTINLIFSNLDSQQSSTIGHSIEMRIHYEGKKSNLKTHPRQKKNEHYEQITIGVAIFREGERFSFESITTNKSVVRT